MSWLVRELPWSVSAEAELIQEQLWAAMQLFTSSLSNHYFYCLLYPKWKKNVLQVIYTPHSESPFTTFDKVSLLWLMWQAKLSPQMRHTFNPLALLMERQIISENLFNFSGWFILVKLITIHQVKACQRFQISYQSLDTRVFSLINIRFALWIWAFCQKKNHEWIFLFYNPGNSGWIQKNRNMTFPLYPH